MTNLNTLEELRTYQELINYFEKLGKSITKEEIETLKKSYEQTNKNNGALTLKQLDDVAGGLAELRLMRTELVERHLANLNCQYNVQEIKIKALNDAGYVVFMNSIMNKSFPESNGKFYFYFSVPFINRYGKQTLGCVDVHTDKLKEIASEIAPELVEALNSINFQTPLKFEEVPRTRNPFDKPDKEGETAAVNFIRDGFNPTDNEAYIQPNPLTTGEEAKIRSALVPATSTIFVETESDRFWRRHNERNLSEISNQRSNQLEAETKSILNATLR